jgi:two-component system KDP operon response regulator KdpE
MPIIMLSVRGDEVDKVRALDEGADDYVTKPFGIDELLARIRVALRRAKNASSPGPAFVAGDLEVDFSTRLVKRHGKVLKLTPTEYELLTYLVSNRGKVVSHRQILHSVWGTEYGEESEYVRVFIRQLRIKIEEDPSDPQLIRTETRVGYRFVPPE